MTDQKTEHQNEVPQEETEDEVLSAPSETELLERLRSLVVAELIKRIETGTARAFDMSNAVRLLKDSGTSKPRQGKSRVEEHEDLPFVGEEEGKPSGNWNPLQVKGDGKTPEALSVPFKVDLPFGEKSGGEV